MNSQKGEKTMTASQVLSNYRTTATIVGILYIAGMVIGIGGNILILSILSVPDYLSTVSANSMLIAIGALLWLFTVAGDAAHGILMFPILKRFNETIAAGYLGFRIVDAVFIAIMVLFILLQIPLGSEYVKAGANTSTLQALGAIFTKGNLYAYHIAMLTLGISSVMLCYTLYNARLVPRFLAVWGFVGYVTILFGSAFEILGFNLQLLHTIPGGVWELFIGVWLIVKGFNTPATVSESA